MPRIAKGRARVLDGSVYALVTVGPKKTAGRALKWLAVDDLDAGTAWAGALQELVDALRAAGRSSEIDDKLTLSVQVGADDLEGGLERVRAGVAKLRAGTKGERIATVGASSKKTFKKFAEHWTSGKLHEEYPDHVADKKTADDDVSRLVKYIYPIIGPLPLGDVTLKHAQDVLRRIPVKASRSTRRHVAQLMVRVFNLAVYPSEVHERSPLPRGFLPKVGPRKAGAYLYPDEDRALLACVETEDGGGAARLPRPVRLPSARGHALCQRGAEPHVGRPRPRAGCHPSRHEQDGRPARVDTRSRRRRSAHEVARAPGHAVCRRSPRSAAM